MASCLSLDDRLGGRQAFDADPKKARSVIIFCQGVWWGDYRSGHFQKPKGCEKICIFCPSSMTPQRNEGRRILCGEIDASMQCVERARILDSLSLSVSRNEENSSGLIQPPKFDKSCPGPNISTDRSFKRGRKSLSGSTNEKSFRLAALPVLQGVEVFTPELR